jgi:MATE family multidrug resistance protein
MAADIIVNVVNIAASIILALHLGFGFSGVALGTVIAQYSGLIFASAMVVLKYRKKVFIGHTLKNAAEALRDKGDGKFFSLNRDLVIRSLCFIGIYIGFTVISAEFGDLMLASSAIIMKLLMIFSYFIDGFAYAGEALTGRYVGRKDKTMVRKTVKSVFNWSWGAVAFFVILYGLLGVPMIRIMTSDASVIAASRQFIPWLMAMPAIGCAAFTWDGIYAGATASKGIRNAAIGAVVAFFAVWMAGISMLRRLNEGGFFPNGDHDAMAIHILLAAYFTHLLYRTVYLSARYRKDIMKS